MHCIDVKCKIRNPDMETNLSVALFDSLEESIKIMGEDRVLEVVNSYVISRERINWNTRIVNSLSGKTKDIKG